MDLFKLLEDIEEHVQSCRHVPMTGKILIDEEALLDFIDRIRSLLPEEIHQAKMMVRDRERLLEDAREEAERIVAEASQRIEGMIRESEMVRQAQSAAEEVIAQGRHVALEIKNNATLYADEIMGALEANIEQNLAVIRNGREELNQMRKTGNVIE